MIIFDFKTKLPAGVHWWHQKCPSYGRALAGHKSRHKWSDVELFCHDPGWESLSKIALETKE